MSERQIKEYYERIEKLLNGANKETYGFAPQEIKNILISYEELQNQNQELKNQLETLEKSNKQLISKLDRYDAIVDERDELKKKLEEYQLQNIDLRADIMIQKMAFPHKAIKDKTFYELYDMPNYEDLLNQQKEFIEYLENCINELKKESINELQNAINLGIVDITKEILSKYKKIIGNNEQD